MAKRNIVEAAGRCLKEKSDLALLFKAAIRKVHDIDRINYERGRGKTFPIQWTRAIWRVLYLREHAPDAMERNDADLFAKCIMRNMEIFVEDGNYAIAFMQSVRMFLYLLRFRIKEQSFLSYTTSSYKKLFKATLFATYAPEIYDDATQSGTNTSAHFTPFSLTCSKKSSCNQN